eukprot:m.190964 g.190964  ORF g.190964 m.190964 type:complete len:216 (+) comp18188_c0_seq1:55-702(+)
MSAAPGAPEAAPGPASVPSRIDTAHDPSGKRARMSEGDENGPPSEVQQTEAQPRGVALDEALEKEEESFGTEEAGYEYLDHTADIQLHGWGRSVEESFEQVTLAMFGYMTDLTKVDEDPEQTQEFDVDGHDLLSLLYNLMDEFLFRFVTEPFVVCRRIKVLSMDKEKFRVRVQGFGEVFDLEKHTQGTEVKAITYSNMQIHHDKPRKDIYVIVDI